MKNLIQISFFAFTALLFTCCTPRGEKLDQVEKRGNEIIEALEQFKTENGTYPDSLETLIPKYLNTLEQPVWGLNEWIYSDYEEQFFLEVHESRRTGDGNSHWFRYSGDKLGWQYGD